MSDLISRKSVLNILRKLHIDNIAVNDKRVTEYIRELPSVTDTNVGSKWIPCSERLPEEDKMSEYYESVIATLDNGRVVNGCYRNADEEWWVDAECGEKYSINVTGHVIAWMPLPEPYKGE